MQGGMTTLPTDAASVQYFVETVWNSYYLQGDTITGEPNLYWDTGYYQNSTSSGGVDPTQPGPALSAELRAHPVTSDPARRDGARSPRRRRQCRRQSHVPGAHGGHGRQRRCHHAGRWHQFRRATVGLSGSAAQRCLRRSGSAQSRLHERPPLHRSAIAPASFNDVLSGNNTSSFLSGGDYRTPGENSGYSHVTPTGYGYEAGEGYDLVSAWVRPTGWCWRGR